MQNDDEAKRRSSTRPRPLKSRSQDRLETETSRRRLHPWLKLFFQLYLLVLTSSEWHVELCFVYFVYSQYIIPQGNDTFDLRQLVTNIESMYADLPKPPPNFIFANNYFFFDSLQASTSSSPTLATSDVNVFLSSEMTVLKHTTRVPISPPGYSVKSVIDPHACLAMQNHYCWAVTPQFSDRTKSAVIDHSLGLNHHYKYCHFEKSECNSLISRTSVNDVMLKYRTQLVARVAAKIRTIFGNSQSDVEQLTFWLGVVSPNNWVFTHLNYC